MSGADGQGPTLRYRPFGGGYRREDVEAESELRAAKAELQAYHAEERLEAAVRRAEGVLNQAESN